jgi:nitrate reductase gamma subunit
MSDHALFVMAPYLAGAILLAGTLRGLLNPSRHARRDRVPAIAGVLGRRHRILTIGLLGTSLGHALIVGWPERLASLSQPLGRLVLVEAVLFVFGLGAVAGLLMVISSHARRSAQDHVAVIDVTFVAVFLVAIVSGLVLPLLYRWAVAWSGVTLAPYMRSVASLQPDLSYLESMPYLVKLHVFSTSVLVALVPFTTPVRAWLAHVNRTIDRALMPIGSALDRGRTQFQDWTRRAGRGIQFQEDDE